MGSTKKSWSYKTGERSRNRVRAFEDSKSGMLMLEFYEAGKRKRVSLGHRDRGKAKQQADEAAARIGKAEPLRSEDITLQELFDIYLGEVTPGKTLRVQMHDRAAAKLFLRCFGARRSAKELNRRDWDRFVKERTSGRLRPPGSHVPVVGPRTVSKDLKWLLAVLNWATMAGDGRGRALLDQNPLKGMPLPSEPSPRRPLATQERYEAMVAVADQIGWRFRVALVLSHETGHRIGAVRQLRWSDIDLERGTVRWRKQGDKIGHEHDTPLSPQAKAVLESARQEEPAIGDAWILPSPKDRTKPCRAELFTKWWKRAEGLAGVEHVEWLGWHGLRRKFATELRQEPLRDICDLGGWKNPETVVQCYQQSNEADLRAALKRRATV
jgi:integrase